MDSRNYSNIADATTTELILPGMTVYMYGIFPPHWNYVDLNWYTYHGGVHPPVTGIRLRRATNPDGPWTTIHIAGPNDTYYRDNTVTYATTYYYRACIEFEGARSDYYNVVNATTPWIDLGAGGGGTTQMGPQEGDYYPTHHHNATCSNVPALLGHVRVLVHRDTAFPMWAEIETPASLDIMGGMTYARTLLDPQGTNITFEGNSFVPPASSMLLAYTTWVEMAHWMEYAPYEMHIHWILD